MICFVYIYMTYILYYSHHITRYKQGDGYCTFKLMIALNLIHIY